MIPLNFPINSTSLGASAFHILRNIKEEYSLFPIGGGVDVNGFEPCSNELKEKIQKATLSGLASHDINNTSVRLWHHFASMERISKKQVLYTFHEVDRLTKIETNCLNQQESIIVPCNYNKEVFQSNGVKPPVHVVPLGVDRNIFYPLEKYKKKSGPFIFIMAGKFEVRKLHIEILQAFLNVFGNNPDVKLRCCITNKFVDMRSVHELITQQIFRGQKVNNVEFIDWLPTESHYADFLSHADCLVAPSRGESFNLPLLQAMSCGINVITNFDHAHRDYASSSNSIEVKSEGTVVAQDNTFFRNDGITNTGQWSNINGNAIAIALIETYKRGRSVNTNGIETAKKYTWENTANNIIDIWNKYK